MKLGKPLNKMRDKQLNLLFQLKNYSKQFQQKSFAPELDNVIYFPSFTNCIGTHIVERFSDTKKNILEKISIIIKDILYSKNYTSHLLYFNKSFKDYNKIIVTWAFKENFNSKGVLKDKYFNISSDQQKKTLWFVIFMGNSTPKKLKKNIVLLKMFSSKIFGNIIVLKNFFSNFIYIFKNLDYLLFINSNHNFFSKKMVNFLKPFLNNQVKYLLMPYEGQPFQNEIISYIKQEKNKIKTIGYIHSPPLAMPSNFLYKYNSPDKIILNGKDQEKCFTKILGWKKSKVFLFPSFRFLKNKTNIKKNLIYLPLNVRDIKIVYNSIKFLDNNNFINLVKFSVKKHPAGNSEKNYKTKKMIENLIKDAVSVKSKNKENFLIFIGSSGAIIEALERGNKVIQISDQPILDIYSDAIWPSIKRTKLSDNIFLYNLKKKGDLIKLGSNIKNLSKIFN
ncbi:hypothetical protein IDH18_01610 [Pelagibacterales bacterium SAG-MED41]|nr:hypothetical protein [Pelagibacterales bacterium SAG-MED41]|tara:strand:- start:673 stop:2019 length:1347 start_codon:yes stop_codon:yes gene_type:complete